jgi:hypothetical protein
MTEPTSIKAKASLGEVRRVAPFMATNDIRYYLNGLLIERAPQGGVYVVATDGHTMGISHDPDGMIEGADRVIVHVTKPLLTAKPPKYGRLGRSLSEPLKNYLLLTGGRLSVATDFGMECTNSEAAVQAGHAVIEGNFPDWRRVLPDFDKLKPGLENTVNATLFEKFVAASHDSGKRVFGTALRLWQVEQGGVVAVQMPHRPQFLGLVMPMRADDEATDLQKMAMFKNARSASIKPAEGKPA